MLARSATLFNNNTAIAALVLLLVSILPSEARANSQSPALYCGQDGTPCLTRIVNRDQIESVSQSYVLNLPPIRSQVAQLLRKPLDELEKIWGIAVGPPQSLAIIALVDGKFVPFLMALPSGNLSRLTFSTPPGLVGRQDVRSIIPVDFLGDGGRQILVAGDTMAGSGLGQASIFIYRLQGKSLQLIFESELDSNSMSMSDDDNSSEASGTSFTWVPSSGLGTPIGIVATKTMSSGRRKTTQTHRYGWNGYQFVEIPKQQPPTRMPTANTARPRF